MKRVHLRTRLSGHNGPPVILNRPRRSASHKEKVAGKQMLRYFGGDVKRAKRQGWL